MAKKSKIAAAVIAVPLTLSILTACGGTPTLSFTSNWYKLTSLGADIAGTEETLEYKVTFVAPESKSDFSVSYDEGTYKAVLTSELKPLADGTNEVVYVYNTELKISGRYSYKDQTGETFTDEVTSEAVFRNVSKLLAPVSSKVTAKSNSPVSLSPSDLASGYKKYDYTLETSYDLALTEAKVVYNDMTLKEPAPKETTINIKSDATYLDNSEIVFALRGANLASSLSFRSINPVTNAVMSLATSEVNAVEYELGGAVLDGQASSAKINAYKIGLRYQSDMGGGTQYFWYAKLTDSKNNTYRNVPLMMELPISYGLGTLRYTLVKADFTEQ